ncbi:related to mRNA cleavage factor complex component Pcf11 [Lecanosticta acicola]|uniref:Related to mRNA cleavage factor complex component Pcf11 n=1 Tax=Lecanosticta acicola TaxID=111012 RepID=A0AAI8YTV7_9PEZI|nr:related to mRNA cleavage factor complex component Pcf11 [Lecanosticta acicola]
MSSRSPRGSLSGASTSAEVAADFAESLRDLQNNNRYEISNLTIIAKENTEHAQEISKALENHIKTTAATRKLPALFVLDSIVKNVGTPYTVYLGRNLFSTFMDAYTLVDAATRRHMDQMLKTWKEPVPGSIDPRSVFPVDTVRPIENALIKAKTAALQSSRPPNAAYRGTATPPQHYGQFATPPQQLTPQPYGRYPSHQSTPQPYASNPYTAPGQPPLHDVESIKHEISLLIPRFHQKIAMTPHDSQLRSQLSALETLNSMLDSRPFSPQELQQIRTQVSGLSAALPPHHYAPPAPKPVPTPQWQQPVSFPPPHQPPPQAFPAAIPLPLHNPTAAAPPLPPTAINNLQALLASVPKPSTPQMRAAMPEIRDASHSQLHTLQNNVAAPTTNGASDLLSSLAQAGLMKPPTTSMPMPFSAPPATATPAVDTTASLLKSLQGILPMPAANTPTQMQPALPLGLAPGPVTAKNLKVFRPELVHALYDAQSNQCNMCGRRFATTEEGREKKSRHLDWHFRTNQRIADPNANRGHHRNWYVDEMQWAQQVEFDPSTTTASAADAAASAAKPKKGPQDQTIRAPPGMTKNTCNICFEEMRISRSEDQQDWVFTNATKQGNKIVHATCLTEMMKGAGGSGAGGSLAAALASVGGGQRERSATPDSLLGKRKAESSMGGGSVRLKTE